MPYFTITEILAVLAKFKPMTKRHLWRYLKALNIQPIGARTRPRMYPADTAERILAHLGMTKSAAKLPSMAQLKTAKRSTTKKGTK